MRVRINNNKDCNVAIIFAILKMSYIGHLTFSSPLEVYDIFIFVASVFLSLLYFCSYFAVKVIIFDNDL